MLYIVKSGDNIFEYEKLCDEMNLMIINQLLHIRNFPLLNGNDMQLLRSSGGTVICKKTDGIYWLINLEHEKEIDYKYQIELVNIIKNLRNSVKRDLKLNKILGI